MSDLNSSKDIDETGSTEATRRTVLKAAAYITPAVVTMAVAPAFASAGSREVTDTRRGRNGGDSKGRERGPGRGNSPVRNRGGRERGRGSSGS